MLRLQADDRQLPRRATSDRQVRWVAPTYKAIHDILTNPVFAGAYAYGRKRTERRVEGGVVRERQRRAPREEWHVCIGVITPATSPSIATWRTRSGCARTGERHAGRAAARRARAERCCRA